MQLRRPWQLLLPSRSTGVACDIAWVERVGVGLIGLGGSMPQYDDMPTPFQHPDDLRLARARLRKSGHRKQQGGNGKYSRKAGVVHGRPPFGVVPLICSLLASKRAL